MNNILFTSKVRETFCPLTVPLKVVYILAVSCGGDIFLPPKTRVEHREDLYNEAEGGYR